MSRFTIHDSENVSLIVASVPITDGRAEEFVTIEPNGPFFEEVIGADGHVCRYATHDTMWTMTVRLLDSSKHNQVLSALLAADVNAPGGAGVGGLLLDDKNGATKVASPHCWISEHPGVTKSKGVGTKEWKFRFKATPATVILGGN